MSEIKEEIKHAAIRTLEGLIFIGKDHAQCFRTAQAVNAVLLSQAMAQGFLTNKARFVDREEAATIAINSNQLPEGSLVKEQKILFSEDLWSEQYCGRYNYDAVNGYILKNED